MKALILSAAVFAAAIIAAGPAIAQPTPPKADPKAAFGAPNFVPSPERPTGWRGDGSGRYPGATPPTSWERKHNGDGYAVKGIAWAAELPAGGLSTPIVVGDRVFLTSEPTDMVCLDKKTGRILWIHSNPEIQALTADEIKADPALESVQALGVELEKVNLQVVDELNARLGAAPTAAWKTPPAVNAKRELHKKIQDQLNAIDKKKFDHAWPQAVYGYATETPVSDGKYVCAYFSIGLTVCYDMDGKRLWIARGANGGEEKGNYTSPVIANGQVVVWGGPELRAYDIATGKQLWSNTARGANASSLYRMQVGDDWVVAFRNYFVRVKDGAPIWGSKDVDNSIITPIVEGGALITPMGNKGEWQAMKLPGSTDGGKLSSAVQYKTEWADNELPKTKDQPFDRGFTASPLFVDGLVYRISSGGGMFVNDATTGELVYRKILPMKPVTKYWAYGGASASPALAGKNIYLMDNQGTTVIIQPGKEYKEVAVNLVEDATDGKNQTQNLACPIFDGSRLYYRTPAHLYCIGDK